MIKITILKPKTAKPDELIIDTVVKAGFGLRRISKLRYCKKELYFIPITHERGKPGIDFKTSYHCTGQIHTKLTRGKLKQATWKFSEGKTELLGIETLGEAVPTDKDSEIVLWEEKGIPLNSIKGVVNVHRRNTGVQNLMNIEKIAAGYPILKKGEADYVFEIDIKPTPLVDISHLLVEPDNKKALEEFIKTTIDIWNKNKNFQNLPGPKFKYLEKAVLFTNFDPWLCIALFRFNDVAGSSESLLSGQPDFVPLQP